MAVPLLIAVAGVGMVGGGLFRPDPELGWPVGTPDAVPDRLSTTATLHIVFAVATFMITTPPWGDDSASIRFAVATVIIFGWLTRAGPVDPRALGRSRCRAYVDGDAA